MNNKRYIARFIIEADTPLFVGSGEASLITDALVQRDFNGLPMIYGTSLTGVLRHSLEDFNKVNKKKWQDIFGYQDQNKGKGARLRVSNAYMMLNESKCAEGIQEIKESILSKYQNLPVRQHVKINDRGTSQKGGLYDNEICYKGTRFIFEVELIGTQEDQTQWNFILQNINHPAFRIGQGTRNGYGSLKVIKQYEKIYDLTNKEDFDTYLNFDASLNATLEFTNSVVHTNPQFTEYKLKLKPDSLFFNFSSGYGDTDVDNTPLEEEIVIYEENTIIFEDRTVIPASSIKGALSHRVCFHYNKLNKKFAENLDSVEKNKHINANNQAVFSLFGGESDLNTLEKDDTEPEKSPLKKQRGKIILNDLYYNDVDNNKIFNHVAIDRFTGGGMDGALFSEKVSYKKDQTIEFSIFVQSYQDDDNQHIEKALENTLTDLCQGLLPLGGMTTKGNGIFVGTLTKNNEIIYKYGK